MTSQLRLKYEHERKKEVEKGRRESLVIQKEEQVSEGGGKKASSVMDILSWKYQFYRGGDILYTVKNIITELQSSV